MRVVECCRKEIGVVRGTRLEVAGFGALAMGRVVEDSC